jgi:hypothetical protein
MISVVAGDSFWAIGWGQTSENKQSKKEPSTCFLHSNVIFIILFLFLIVYPTYLMQVQIAILSANKCSQWNIDGSKQIFFFIKNHAITTL